ncbi:hypothetical protein I3760_09G226000 [Carya illinoinensis]|nr:hypothetical protein I3760_09G226000 [Carya illinoinensis]
MRRRRCLIALGATLFLLALLFIISLTLALTMFKPNHPQFSPFLPPLMALLLVSHSLPFRLNSISPSTSSSLLRIETMLASSMDKVRVLLYQGNQVGEADIYPGLIPARCLATLPCCLKLEVEELASNLIGLINDVVGKISFLGIFRKLVFVVNECQLTISVLDMTIRRQTCKGMTKL